MSKELQLTENHIMTYDSYQFILKTRTAKAGDETYALVKKGDPPRIIKEDKYEKTYFPTIKMLCDSIVMDELKSYTDNFKLLAEVNEKFDELIANPHIERLEMVATWFSNFAILKPNKKKRTTKKDKE